MGYINDPNKKKKLIIILNSKYGNLRIRKDCCSQEKASIGQGKGQAWSRACDQW